MNLPFDDSQDTIPKLVFRCFKCWMLLGYIGTEDHMNCPKCGQELYVGYQDHKTIEGAAKNTVEYNRLLFLLGDHLKTIKDIVEIECEEISCAGARHKPDVMYKNCLEEYPKLLIYEIETCDTILADDTVSKCRLFAETALNIDGHCHIIVPKDCSGQSGKDKIKEILRKNEIRGVEIICF